MEDTHSLHTNPPQHVDKPSQHHDKPSVMTYQQHSSPRNLQHYMGRRPSLDVTEFETKLTGDSGWTEGEKSIESNISGMHPIATSSNAKCETYIHTVMKVPADTSWCYSNSIDSEIRLSEVVSTSCTTINSSESSILLSTPNKDSYNKHVFMSTALESVKHQPGERTRKRSYGSASIEILDMGTKTANDTNTLYCTPNTYSQSISTNDASDFKYLKQNSVPSESDHGRAHKKRKLWYRHQHFSTPVTEDHTERGVLCDRMVASKYNSLPETDAPNGFGNSRTDAAMVPNISGPNMVPNISGPNMVPNISGPNMVPNISGPNLVSNLSVECLNPLVGQTSVDSFSDRDSGRPSVIQTAVLKHPLLENNESTVDFDDDDDVFLNSRHHAGVFSDVSPPRSSCLKTTLRVAPDVLQVVSLDKSQH